MRPPGRFRRWLKRGCAVGVVVSVLVMGLSLTTITLVDASWRWSLADDGLVWARVGIGARSIGFDILREDPYRDVPTLWVVEEPAPMTGWNWSCASQRFWEWQPCNWHEVIPISGGVSKKRAWIGFPTWSPLAFFMASFFILHRRDRRLAHRLKHNLCTRCGYSRAGIAEGAACPECGEGSASASKTSPAPPK